MKEPLVGDVFTVRGRGVLGRVVSTEAIVGPTHGCILVYVYAGEALARDELLVPPMLTTRAPWSHGLFETVRSEPLLPGSFFDRHCFRDGARFVDEEGRPVKDPTEPIGEYKLLDVSAIERALSAATT
ncbi:MAG TPA: hypothetical protein VF765_00180 [Polyangiaceae bacterium]